MGRPRHRRAVFLAVTLKSRGLALFSDLEEAVGRKKGKRDREQQGWSQVGAMTTEEAPQQVGGEGDRKMQTHL